MEIFITVLITLMVVALIGAGISLVRLKRKVDNLDNLNLELVDVERNIGDLRRELDTNSDNMNRDLVDRINGVISSTDRRFDKLYDDVRRMEEVVSPNKDIKKRLKK